MAHRNSWFTMIYLLKMVDLSIVTGVASLVIWTSIKRHTVVRSVNHGSHTTMEPPVACPNFLADGWKWQGEDKKWLLLFFFKQKTGKTVKTHSFESEWKANKFKKSLTFMSSILQVTSCGSKVMRQSAKCSRSRSIALHSHVESGNVFPA